MSFVIEDVLVRHDPVGHPDGRRVPVLFDSPHSGTVYPSGFTFACPLALLRQTEDAFVDELFAAAPEQGATLLAALFPRACVDVNRAVDDIDPAILDGEWPEPLRPSPRSAHGMGLIRTLCRPGVPLYDGRLPVAEVAERIGRYYHPYHFQVSSVLDGLAARFGGVWHVNCHSMPSRLGWEAPRPVGVDFVIGDRDGTSSEPEFVAFVAAELRSMGYSVAVNAPFKGVELVGRYANPARNRHSIQVEINRALYMDEETLQRHAGFEPLRRALTTLTARIADYAEANTIRRAAE